MDHLSVCFPKQECCVLLNVFKDEWIDFDPLLGTIALFG